MQSGAAPVQGCAANEGSRHYAGISVANARGMRSFLLVLTLAAAACGKSSDKPATTASGDGLPPECADFKAAVAKIQTCDKITPELRANIQRDYDRMHADWMNMSANMRSKLGRACKVGVDAFMNDGIKKTCGW